VGSVRFIARIFSVFCFLVCSAAIAIFLGYNVLTKEMPDCTKLHDYEPPVMTRIRAADGSLAKEYSEERRVFVPIHKIPDLVKNAFISAEDKNFYNHDGIDVEGIARVIYLQFRDFVIGRKRRAQGASTITQQVARIFFLSPERSYVRKMREWILARRLESILTKDQILEIYLNQIFMGFGSYGVAAASLQYFDTPLKDLSVAQAAFLAALPKAPNNYHPTRHRDRAVDRRNSIIRLMASNGYLSEDEAISAQTEPLVIQKPSESSYAFASKYFMEEVRRWLISEYGEKGLYRKGLSVQTTMNPKVQIITRKALIKGLIGYDTEQGYRGSVKRISLVGDWGNKLAKISKLSDVPEWRLAVVLQIRSDGAVIGLQPSSRRRSLSIERKRGVIPFKQLEWAGVIRGEKGLAVGWKNPLVLGDVVWVEQLKKGPSSKFGLDVYALRQVPEIAGAAVVMDPRTGAVLAVSGGFSFARSEFNRATQAWRQPGSSFKPIIYAAALDSGYTPSSVIFDAPVEIQLPNGTWWKPKNYGNRYFFKASILRTGIELSRNAMTVRLAKDMGMPLIIEYARRFGIYDDLTSYLSASLGAKETTLMRMVSAYATIANGGKRFEPKFIGHIKNRYGEIIYRSRYSKCLGCDFSDDVEDETEPADEEEKRVVQVLDPMTAYQVTSMMEGVVQNGTGKVLKNLNRPVAGKTGSTNEEKDAWFIAFTPELVVGVYVGFDHPRPMGQGKTGGRLAAPIVRDILRAALKDVPPMPFHMPSSMQVFRINRDTGRLARPRERNVVLEAFKPGTAPPSGSTRYAVIGE